MYIYGKNVAEEAISSKQKINKVFLYKNFSDIDIVNSLKEMNVPIKYLEKNQLDNMNCPNNQGIILEVDDYSYSDIGEIKDGLVVILDHIEDPHNLGAIIRTCEAAGVEMIVIPKDRACKVNATVIKTSAGAINNMKIALVTNLNQTIRYLKDNGYWIIGTDMNGDDYRKLDYKGKTCIVIGNEGKGLSESVYNNCDFMAKIPMVGKINSLNASVATGIIIFEALRSRNGL